MRRLPAIAIVVAGVLATPAVAAFIAEVTIRARIQVDPSSRLREVELTGSIASRAAGETVEVLAKECGPAHRHFRLLGSTRTAPGGTWRLVESDDQVPNELPFPENAYYVARWKSNQSEPALIRVPANVGAAWRPRARVVDVRVSSLFTGQNLRGRAVELQRRLPGTDEWVLVRRARLGAGSWERFAGRVFRARFAVPTRGLTLRVLVPETTGAPCFSAAASGEFRS